MTDLRILPYANIIIGKCQYVHPKGGTILARGAIIARVEDEELVLVAEAARLTGYSAEWLRHLVDTGKVRGKRIGRYYAIPDTEVQRLKKAPRSNRGRPRRPRPPAAE
jgi:excisionase family DNA binding protein